MCVCVCAVLLSRRKSRNLDEKIQELEASLIVAMEKCAAERQGRIRAQQVYWILNFLDILKLTSD